MLTMRRLMSDGSVMVSAGNGYFGKTSIQFINGKMNSVQYINVIKEQINNYAERISGRDFTFQQDNASVHTSRLIQSYFNENNISVLWSVCSPNLNIIKHCWSQLVRVVSKNGKQYHKLLHELKNAIIHE